MPAIEPSKHLGEHANPAEIAAGWSAIQVRTILICFILNMLDGADVVVISYAAENLSNQWNLSATTLGLLFSAGLAGMMVGSIAVAPLADIIGRRRLIIIALTVIALSMIGSGFSQDVRSLLLLRFIVGIGVGCMLASIAVLASEFAPPAHRSFAVMFSTAGYPLGAVMVGLLAVYLLPIYGWRALFIAVGAASVFTIPICLALLPESIAFLSTRQSAGGLIQLNRIRVAMHLPELDALPSASLADARRASVGRLFAEERKWDTLKLWSAFFTAYVTLYFLVSWIPKSISDAGFTQETAVLAGAVFNFGALIGIPTLGGLTVRTDVRYVISWAFVCACFVMAITAFFHSSEYVLFPLMFALGFLVQGGFSGLYAVATRLYPAGVRSTGVGWSIGAGRLGAVAGPYLGGLTVAAGAGFGTMFFLFAVPLGIAAIVIRRVARDQAAQRP